MCEDINELTSYIAMGIWCIWSNMIIRRITFAFDKLAEFVSEDRGLFVRYLGG